MKADKLRSKTMTVDYPPQTPPAVVRYVEEKTNWKKIVPSGTWHQYRVYYMDPQLPDDGRIRCIGLPAYLLYDGKIVRFADGDETYDIMAYKNSKITPEQRRENLRKFKEKQEARKRQERREAVDRMLEKLNLK